MTQFRKKDTTKSKGKQISILAILLILSLFSALALTYAWFTGNINSGLSTVKMGRLTVDLEGLSADGQPATNGSVVLFNSDNAVVVPGEIIPIQNVIATFGTGDTLTNIDFVLRAKVVFDGDEALDTELTNTLTGLHVDFGVLEPSDGWYYYLAKIPALTSSLTLINSGSITIPTSYESPDDHDKTLVISLEVEACQADWTDGGVLTPSGASFTATEIADVFANTSGEEGEVYTASPHTVIANAGSLSGDNLVAAINASEDDFVFVPLNYQTFEEKLNSSVTKLDTSKTVLMYQKENVVSSYSNQISPKQVLLSSKVNLAKNQEVSIVGLYQSENTKSYALAVPEYIENITVTNIADYAFAYNMALTGVTFSRYVKTIGEYAFLSCENMETAIFKSINRSQCTSIGFAAFAGTGLTTFTVPRSVTTIGDAAFAFTSNLTAFSVYGGRNFRADSGVLTNYARTTLYNYPGAKTSSSYTIPSTITKICSFAFNESLEEILTSISMSNGLVDIGESSLPNWLATTSSTGIKYFIGGNAAYVGGIFGTNEVADPETLTNSDISTFWTEMSNAGKNVRAIAAFAFFGASNVTSITLPSTLKGIGYASFSFTGITSITIPSSVTFISPGAFWAINLSTITVSGGSYFKTVSGVLLNYAGTTLLCYPGANAATSYSIPSTVTRVEDYAFYHASNLTTITFAGTSCNYLGIGSFSGTSITSFTIPNSVTKLYDATFADCHFLESINIHQYITLIGTSCFQCCWALTSVTFSVTSTCTTIGEFAFATCLALKSIALPASCVNVHPDAFHDIIVEFN